MEKITVFGEASTMKFVGKQTGFLTNNKIFKKIK